MIRLRARRPRRILTPSDLWYFASCRSNVFWRAWEEHWNHVLHAEVIQANKFGLN